MMKLPIRFLNQTWNGRVCSLALGHPIEYIQLDTVSNKPQICKYCGLRFVMGHHGHH